MQRAKCPHLNITVSIGFSKHILQNFFSSSSSSVLELPAVVVVAGVSVDSGDDESDASAVVSVVSISFATSFSIARGESVVRGESLGGRGDTSLVRGGEEEAVLCDMFCCPGKTIRGKRSMAALRLRPDSVNMCSMSVFASMTALSPFPVSFLMHSCMTGRVNPIDSKRIISSSCFITRCTDEFFSFFEFFFLREEGWKSQFCKDLERARGLGDFPEAEDDVGTAVGGASTRNVS